MLAFVPSSLGPETAGTWQPYFQGGSVEISSVDVDALTVSADGKIHLSTQSAFAVNAVSGNDNDAFTFVPETLGESTLGSYLPTLLFDASQHGLRTQDLRGIDMVTESFSAASASATPNLQMSITQQQVGFDFKASGVCGESLQRTTTQISPHSGLATESSAPWNEHAATSSLTGLGEPRRTAGRFQHVWQGIADDSRWVGDGAGNDYAEAVDKVFATMGFGNEQLSTLADRRLN